MNNLKKYFNGDTVFGALVTAVCIWFFVEGQKLASVKFGSGVDAGFFPRMLAILVGLMGIGLIIQGIRKPQAYFSNVEKKNLMLCIKTVVVFALYIILWPYIHFIPLTLAVLVVLCKVLNLSWKFTIPYSLIMSFGLFYLFASVFKIILN